MGRFILNWSQFCIILLAVLQEQFGRLTVPLSVCGSFRALKEGTFFCLGMTALAKSDSFGRPQPQLYFIQL